MLAEALRGISGAGRCLLDAGDPASGHPPATTQREAARATDVYVVGGPAAISDTWLRSRLGVNTWTRVAGGNRWETQSAVAAAIISLANGQQVSAYDGAASSTPTLPPNTGCQDGAVIAKLGVIEDRAAANMLAEALNALSVLGRSRCLVDAGDPGADISPGASGIREVQRADSAYVVGGSVAIPDLWLTRHFGITEAQRVAGNDRWETQAHVAARIVSLARAHGAAGHDAGPLPDAPEIGP